MSSPWPFRTIQNLSRFFQAGRQRLGSLLNISRAQPETIGGRGEAIASAHLRRLGYRIVASSYRTQRSEIDLIALDGRVVVFVEVKTWSRPSEGGPADRVEEEKQRRLTLGALEFLKSKKLLNQPARFDVIEVILQPRQSDMPSVRHFKNAFEAVGSFQMYA